MSISPPSAATLGGKVAAVTGSTSGIGLAIAESLARAGASIALNGYGDVGAALAAVAAHGTRVEHVEADMSSGAGATRFVEEAGERLGRIDILVNNVGIQHVASVDEFPPEKWEAVIAINLSSAFYTTRAALPGMKAVGWGRIINVASAHGLVASPFKSAYVAAKHGMVGFTKSLALELAETDVTANAICPGYVRTPLVEGQVADQARVHGLSEKEVVRTVILAAQPSRRFVEPDEVGALALFLCTDAARSITGAALSVDGGWTAR